MVTAEALQTTEALQHAFQLAYYLHPDEAVAWSLTRDACEHGVLALRNQQAERLEKATHFAHKGREGWETYKPYKQAIPAENLLQVALYRTSLTWERRQEQTGQYQPTREEQLIRYLKHLIWKAIEQNPCHVAVSLGCFLYTYGLADIGALDATWPREKNLERAERRIQGWITDRFGPLGLGSLPNAEERALVRASLSMFAPWFPSCDTVAAALGDAASRAELAQHVLQAYFASDASSATAWQQIHVLIHPCVGVGHLIRVWRRWNEAQDTMAADDPERMLRLPRFGPADDRPPDGAGSPTLRDRLHPPPLTLRDLMTLRDSLDRNRGRRRRFRAGARLLRVDVDGQEVGQVGIAETPDVPIPLTASAVEIVGRDAAGELRLAVFPVPELEGEESGWRQRVTLEGGQIVTLELMLSYDEATGDVTDGRLRIAYKEPAVYVFPLPAEDTLAVAAASAPRDGVQGLPGEMIYQDAALEVWLNAQDGRVILRVYGEDLQGLGDLEARDDETLDTHPVMTIIRTPTAVAYAVGTVQELRGKRLRLALQLHERALDLPWVDLPGEGTP